MPLERPSDDGVRAVRQIVPEGEQGLCTRPPTPGRERSAPNYPSSEAVCSRKRPVEDATFGFRAAGPALLANVSYFEKRVCRWNAQTMKA